MAISQSALNARSRDYHARNRALRNDKSNRYYAANREDQKALRRWERQALRETILAAYGRKCACCGETDPAFLSIDHVHGGGKAHLKQIGGTDGLYRWLRNNEFPKSDFRLLCYNCNLGRARCGGICPHRAEPAE